MTGSVLLTGFEPFLDVTLNPSGEVAARLDGVELGLESGDAVHVHGCVLPVSFERAPRALAEALSELGEAPLAILSLGVHRGPQFRLESRAGARFESTQPDNDGQVGAPATLDGPAVRETPFDLELCVSWLEEAGAPLTTVSDDAGGYLCERVFRAGLDAEVAPALFLHVPPVESLAVGEQLAVVRGFLTRMVADRLTALDS
ncbi:MAG: pyroglutamyl-peptidase I [Planctomycetota bacterium]